MRRAARQNRFRKLPRPHQAITVEQDFFTRRFQGRALGERLYRTDFFGDRFIRCVGLVFKIPRTVCQAFQWAVRWAIQSPATRSLREISSISSSHDEDSGSLVILLPVIKIAIVKNHAVVSNVLFRLKILRIDADDVAAT